MKRITCRILLSLSMLFLVANFLLAQDTPVDKWGATNKNTGKGWPILNTASTPAGNGAMGAAGPPAGNDWATIRGGFSPVSIVAGETFVVTGKIEWVGGNCNDSYIPIRYALTFQDSSNTLNYPNTDSAKWSSTKGSYGYEFTPRTGIGNVANGAGGTGTVWIVNNGNWPSTNSNGGKAIANVVQIPRNAVIKAGVYNFAISVQALANGDNEVRWYLTSEDNKSYWYAGTVIDTLGVTRQFNGVCFGVTGEHLKDTGIKGLNFTEVKVGISNPITVPMPPFTAHYVSQWGATNKNTGKGWPILNTASTMAGNGAMGADGPPAGNDWATLRGGFDMPVKTTTDEAVVITGKIEWVGGNCNDSYIPIRYALTYQDDNNVLNNANTDSAKWSSTLGSYGYEFTPRTGIGNVANGAGGTGTVWIVNNGNWPSTNSNGGKAIANVVQAPRNAVIKAGVYNFAISVQALANGDNEVRWYLTSEDNKSYWYAGTVIDTLGVTSKFNGVCFGVTGEHLKDTGIKGLSLTDVYIEKGKPIDVPMPPFTAHYVSQWGATNKNTGKGWPILNTASTMAGNGAMGADGPPAGNDWATLRGGFDVPVQATVNEAVVVTGKIEWVGGNCNDSYIPIRYALTYQGDNNVLNNANTDSAKWSSTDGSYGYEFTPRTGIGNVANGAGGTGTVWVVKNGNWPSTNSNGGKAIANVVQIPRNAVIKAGVYSFGISVQPLASGANEVRWYLISDSSKRYFYAGTVIDSSGVTSKFNGVCFGVTGEHLKDTGIKGLSLTDVYVEKGKAFDVPKYLEIAIDGNKDEFYSTLKGPKDGYLQLQRFHGNNNGFPKDNNDLSAKVWTAWDEEWFYMYTEVTDDTVAATSTNSYQNDGMELKIDPQPTDSTQAGGSIFAPNLTILGTKGSDTLNVVANDSKKFVRKVVSNGYVLELAIKWSAMKAGTETITPAVGNVFGMAVNIHDNDGSTSTPRQASIQWAAVMRDEVWNTPKYLGSVYFLDGNKLEWDPTNNMTGKENVLPYDGSNAVGVETAAAQLPTKFDLSQNYPNPFNPTTTIKFALPKASNVKLNVFDLMGRNVATLVSGQLGAGYHSVNFNAANLSSGIYFYRIEADDFVSVKKLMLMK